MLHEAMREAGLEKIKRADDEDPTRTQPRSKKYARRREEPAEDTKILEAPREEPMELIDDQPNDHVSHDHIDTNMTDVPDSTNFFEEVNADPEIGAGLEVDWDAEDLNDDIEDHVMSPMMDVLQCLGVSAGDAANFCADVMVNSPKRPTQYGHACNPTFVKVYGQGNIVNASHGVRRNLNVNGLRAFDLRTFKPNGEAWDFNKSSDRREARRYVEEEKPTWVIGCPACTFFSSWNQSMNHRKMDPDVVEKLRREAV